MGQVAAGIAHEVKNPLTAVKGFLQLLREKYPDKYFEIAESELDNALSIIRDFLQVTKPEMVNEPYQVISLAAELESVLNLFQDRLYQVKVTKEFNDTSVTVYGKRSQLKRAFFNLLKNAFESIAGEGEIHVLHYADGDHIVVTIEDSGVGMSQEMIGLLGTPFFTTKQEGTGMGLSQVYSTVYQHGGRIHVESDTGIGTRFYILIPITHQEGSSLTELDIPYVEGQSLREFMVENEVRFCESLLERSELASTVQEIKEETGVDLVRNAVSLVDLTLSNHPHELITFAKKEGVLWARHSLQVSFKLEWLQTIKAVLWTFIYNYYRMVKVQQTTEDFFQLERTVNSSLDLFLSHFTISYNHFKDELLQTQRELVENLSVPIIPLSESVSILPLIGTMDTFRAKTVQEKVLKQIEALRIQTMIIDLSGVSYLDTSVLNHLFHLFDGIELMGCTAVVTGIRADIASALVRSELSLGSNVIKKGNVQQALEELNLTSVQA